MFQFLKEIKSDKNITMKHWRIRCLHFYFGINPKNKYESTLPRFLYEKWCPLFHLTNVLGAFWGPAIIVKLFFVTIFTVTGFVFINLIKTPLCFVFGHIEDFVRKLDSKHAEKKKDREEAAKEALKEYKKTPEYKRNTIKHNIAVILSGVELGSDLFTDFDYFYRRKIYEFADERLDGASDDDHKAFVKELYDAICPKIVSKKEAQAAAKKKKYDLIVHWVNFSKVFFGLFLYLVYAVIAGCFLVGCYYWGIPAVMAVCGFLSRMFVSLSDFNFAALWRGFVLIATIALQIFVVLGGVAVTVWVLAKSKVLSKWGSIVGEGLSPVFNVVNIFFKHVGSMIDGILEFISMFYAENCPGINMIEEGSDEDIVNKATED